MRTLRNINTVKDAHWVGNGFPVSTMFSYHQGAEAFSPFLLLDYAGPVEFGPAQIPRGVGTHPHRGFETVTIVYQGALEHRDSTGQGGVIRTGDVQWMTAGSGILHQEFHSEDFAKTGGTLEMVQLWVNLPADHKMMAPGYQSITSGHIPRGAFPSMASSFRVIAGEYRGVKGPARTVTPMLVMDLELQPGERVTLPIHQDWNLMATVLTGTVQVNDHYLGRDATIATFNNDGDHIVLEANTPARVLITAGEPIDEPVVGHGPFVMNTQEQISTAFRDLESGSFGELPEQ
ncbi:pirin family protein [Aliidiomarina indica]|uniref:pirin family protein n=1 Tax=Aliidiomarina indica TaxID=2749147 RepID=UPI00188EAA51|nr:pirin family protein [Aliidiomarina indica]